MNNKMIEDFAQRYGARIDYQHRTSTIHTYSRAIDYYDNSRSIVDIELSMQAFEYMVEMDSKAMEDYQKYRKEAYIRKQYPAVAKAYDQYKMLLELYK